MLLSRGVDPARIDAVRNRVGRPKESEPEAQESGNSGPPPKNSPPKRAPAPASAPASAPAPSAAPAKGNKSNPKGPQINANGMKKPVPGQEGRPLINPNKPSLNQKKAGQASPGGGDSNGVTQQPSKLSGGSTSQPNPQSSIQRGGNAPRDPGTGKPLAKANKQDRQTKPRAASGNDDSALIGSERVAKDAVSGAGQPRKPSAPSQEPKARRKSAPPVSSRRGQPQAGAEVVEQGDETETIDDDYFEWFRSNEQTPTRYVVKAKDGWKGRFALGDPEDGSAAPEGLEKLPANRKQRMRESDDETEDEFETEG